MTVTEFLGDRDSGAKPGNEIREAAEQVEDDRERVRELPGQSVATGCRGLAQYWCQVCEFTLGPVPCLQMGREGWRLARGGRRVKGQVRVVGVEDAPERVSRVQVPGEQAADGR